MILFYYTYIVPNICFIYKYIILSIFENTLFILYLLYIWASSVAQLVKNPPAMWKTWIRSLSWEDSLEKGKATHSSILAWSIPWTVWSMGRKELDMTERLSLAIIYLSYLLLLNLFIFTFGCATLGITLVAVSKSSSLVALHRHLCHVVASLVVEHRLSRLRGFSSWDSRAPEHRLSSCGTCA